MDSYESRIMFTHRGQNDTDLDVKIKMRFGVVEGNKRSVYYKSAFESNEYCLDGTSQFMVPDT